jgi:hypothetical protein
MAGRGLIKPLNPSLPPSQGRESHRPPLLLKSFEHSKPIATKANKNWQHYCITPITMKNITFENITDAYQLVIGAKIKGKNYDEIFELGVYDANKRGYILYAFEDGVRFDDFNVVISETELKHNYLIENVKVSQSLAA